jgi:hypothetical protein
LLHLLPQEPEFAYLKAYCLIGREVRSDLAFIHEGRLGPSARCLEWLRIRGLALSELEAAS